jgi:hypothetical protein
MSDINYSCGACFHWALQVEGTGPVTIGAPKRGICFGMPPTAFAVINQRDQRVAAQTNLRPVLPESERACGMFLPRDQLAHGMQGLMDGPVGNG